MKTILVASDRDATRLPLDEALADLRPLESGLGTHAGLVVQRDHAVVYIAALTAEAAGLDESDLREVAHRRGAAPASVVVVDVGHGAGSQELAVAVAQRLVDALDGTLLIDSELGLE